MNVTVSRVPPGVSDFTELVRELDAMYAALYGDIYLNYQPHNTLDELSVAAVAYADGMPAACGGMKRPSPGRGLAAVGLALVLACAAAWQAWFAWPATSTWLALQSLCT